MSYSSRCNVKYIIRLANPPPQEKAIHTGEVSEVIHSVSCVSRFPRKENFFRQIENTGALETGPLEVFGSALPSVVELATGLHLYQRDGEGLEITPVRLLPKALAILCTCCLSGSHCH